jgi:hypothetical protein
VRRRQQAEWQSNQCEYAGHSLDAQRVGVTGAPTARPPVLGGTRRLWSCHVIPHGVILARNCGKPQTLSRPAMHLCKGT